MPRGARGGGRSNRRGGGGKKGQARHFTNIQEMEAEEEKNKRMNDWKKRQGEMPSDSDDSDASGDEGAGAKGAAAPRVPGLDSSSEEDSSDGEEKHKGVSHLIDIQNPNRQAQKQNRKISDLDTQATVQLSRREREELEKQRAEAHYRKMHLAGKTEEAQSDMARLALIRKQRAEAAAKRDAEKQKKEAEDKAAEKKLQEKRKQARAT